MKRGLGLLTIAALCLAGCSAPQYGTLGSSELATPASQHCAAEGGKRVVERARDGTIGVCVFADNRQCEEWALLRGDCPRGGVLVAGYATTWERHCAIRGGRMTIPGCALSPAGLYEATLATKTGAGDRTVTLVLGAGRVAMVSTVSTAGGGPSVVPGNWHSSGHVVTVSTEYERLEFEYAGDRLVARKWDRKIWGDAGPGTLTRKR